MPTINLFLGYDQRQPIAFQVAAQSVWNHATCPVTITRLDLRTLPIKRKGLTTFTYSRFLAPWLSDFHGVSVFMDADVLVRGDVAELLAYPLAFPECPVHVVKGSRKFEWASVMVFNNPRCTMLTPEYIDAHWSHPLKFEWVDEVGQLPSEWNHLVGYDKPNPNAKLVHFTQGIPVWDETNDCEFADEWHRTLQQANSTCSFDAIMGASVHPIARQKVGA